MPKNRHVPERSCVACAQKLPKRDLIRIVKTPQGEVTVDRHGKSAGRGAYLCWEPSCWQRGVEKGRLERSLKLEISTQDRSSLLEFYNKEILQAPEPAPNTDTARRQIQPEPAPNIETARRQIQPEPAPNTDTARRQIQKETR